jgi:hypothetical protein
MQVRDTHFNYFMRLMWYGLLARGCAATAVLHTVCLQLQHLLLLWRAGVKASHWRARNLKHIK